MSAFSLSEIIKEIGMSAVVVDRFGTILEVSEGWNRRGSGAVRLGQSYFESCIRPDRHSLELLRGFKNLAENAIDFFATVSWREEAGERKHFLIAAMPHADSPGAFLVLQKIVGFEDQLVKLCHAELQNRQTIGVLSPRPCEEEGCEPTPVSPLRP